MFSRYQRMAGNQVLMVSGTDEHGTPIQVQADREGVPARELADRYNRVIAEDLQGLGPVVRPVHPHDDAQPLRRRAGRCSRALHANGYVVERSQLSAIDPSTGRGLPDRYVEGTCPICGYDGARGDQCDNCGNQLDPQDLVNPRSQDRRQAAEVRRERAVLPRAAGLRRGARRRGCRRRTGWRPNVLKFSENLLERPQAARHHAATSTGACRSRCRAGATAATSGIYVWFDAVIGYLSASVEWARRTGDPDAWRPFWIAGADGRYFMGKDNVVFHSVIWPAILLGASGKPAGTPGRSASSRCRARW